MPKKPTKKPKAKKRSKELPSRLLARKTKPKAEFAPKLEKEKLLPERKVPKGEKPNMLDVAGGAKTVNVKGGGLMEATKRLKAQGLKKGGFPDLSGDGKVTMKDILMGRGVVKKPKKKAKGGSMDNRSAFLKRRATISGNASIFKKAREAKPSGRLNVDDIKRATKLGKGAAAGMAGAMKAGARAMKKAGRLALRGYGKAKK